MFGSFLRFVDVLLMFLHGDCICKPLPPPEMVIRDDVKSQCCLFLIMYTLAGKVVFGFRWAKVGIGSS